jgi:thymidylate kinase
MIVICIEGSHGSGKSTLCKRFESAGYEVLDEAFLDMPDYALHPQSLLMETAWVCSWFQRILKHAKDESNAMAVDANGRQKVFIADRSPFSAVYYSKNKGELLEPLIREHICEVKAAANIEIHTLLVNVEKEVLWNRIQQRLLREPERAKYNEGNREWMERTVKFYQTFEWDMVKPHPLCTCSSRLH